MRGLTDANETVIGSADYAVFGEYRVQSGQSSVFGFTGEQHDTTIRNVYLRARYLTPGLGRFLSADTVQPNAPGTQGYNRYAYVANNPTTWVDPTGHFALAPAAGVAITLSPFWLAIGLAIAAFFIWDCANNSPTGVCSALAAFVITALIVVACVLGAFAGACWTSDAISMPQNPRWWEGNRKWEIPLPWLPEIPIPFTDVNFAPPGGGGGNDDRNCKGPFRHPDWDTIKRFGDKFGRRCYQYGDYIYFLDTSQRHFRPHLEVWARRGSQAYQGIVDVDGGELQRDAKRAKQQRSVKEACGKG